MSDERDPYEIFREVADAGLKPLCDSHAYLLMNQLCEHGLEVFLRELQDDPDLVLEQGLDMVRKIQAAPNSANLSPAEIQQFATPVNFQPMMMATMHVLIIGMQNMCDPRWCVVCQLNTRRTEDGRCACGDPACAAREPGSVPPFEQFLDFIAQKQAEWAVDKGLIPLP